MYSLDHLVYGVPSLEDAIRDIEHRTGVRPIVGGSHPSLGTHNALLSLGNGRYLVLLAYDPHAKERQPFLGVDGCQSKPKLTTWCCNVGGDIDGLIQRFKKNQYQTPEIHREQENKGEGDDIMEASSFGDLFPKMVEEMGRCMPDGNLIAWRFALSQLHRQPAKYLPLGGLVPFLINWGTSKSSASNSSIPIHHPSTSSPQGCVLKELRAYHPNPSIVKDAMAYIGNGTECIFDSVEEGDNIRIIAVIQTPRGIVELS